MNKALERVKNWVAMNYETILIVFFVLLSFGAYAAIIGSLLGSPLKLPDLSTQDWLLRQSCCRSTS